MKIYSYIPIQKLHYIDKKSLYRQTLDIKGIYTYIIYILLIGEHIHTNLRKIEICILPCSCPNYILSLYTKHFVTINLQMYEVGGSKMMGIAPFFLFFTIFSFF